MTTTNSLFDKFSNIELENEWTRVRQELNNEIDVRDWPAANISLRLLQTIREEIQERYASIGAEL